MDGPVWLGWYVYDDFYTFWSSAAPGDVYTHTTGPLRGGHAIQLLGYDDSKSAWLMKNSWGATTGPEGDRGGPHSLDSLAAWLRWTPHA